MGKIKKRGRSGVAATYVSRTKAMKVLQLSLTQFRDLCILKGIYPREPKNRKKAQKGKPQIQTLYHKKDMRFLLHEPLIWKFRALKIYMRRLAKARAKKDEVAYARVAKNKPSYRLDHLVKERYPTFVDALRDLDDPLSMCFLYACFPRMYNLPEADKLSRLSRRLTVEFMLYVIEAKALRKVFVSIKGYYFQVEIANQTITWVMPHPMPYEHPFGQSIDFRVMNTFTEFYVYLLGFVNFRLYHQLNLHYPPKVEGVVESDNADKLDERLVALNHPLRRSAVDDNAEDVDAVALDEIHMDGEDSEQSEKIRKEAEGIRRLQNLFKGLKFFLNREVPREVLTFVIRACGGQVSWASTCQAGASYPETDESITHQIVDRDDLRKPYLSRTYIQPQWVFDSINARERKPVEKYFPGVELPAHLSPFYDYEVDASAEEANEPGTSGVGDSGMGSAEESDEEVEDEEVAGEEGEESGEEEEGEEEGSEEESEEEETTPLTKMTVSAGKYVPPNKERLQEKEEREHMSMRKMMIPRKHRRLYGKMVQRKKRLAKDERVLKEKREEIADFKKKQKKKSF